MDRLYFSKETSLKMSLLHESNLTLVEAPAGYGKTTAVLKAMEGISPEQVHWFTAVSFLQDTSIDWFIRWIEVLDEHAGEQLRALGFLNRSNAGKAADILSRLSVLKPCYLIMDNFQLIGNNWPLPLLQALADRPSDGLKLILISQNFGKLRVAFENTIGVTYFTFRDLVLTKRNILEYAKQLDLELTAKQADDIYRKTEGWVAAVALYFENMLENGTTMPDFCDMDDLLYELLWRKLSKEDQDILLKISVFDCIRKEQMQTVVIGEQSSLQSLFRRTPLTRYDSREQAVYLHELLRHFLRGMLEKETADFKNMVYENAGEIYLQAGNDKKAVESFFLSGNYEKLLAADLTALMGENFGKCSFPELARKVLFSCSGETLLKYPLSMLRLCLALFAGTDFDGFAQAMEKSKKLIEKSADPQLLGEWQLAAAFLDFPDISKMKEHYLKAEELMCAPSALFTYRELFLFGTTSMWYLFYRTPGKMMETAEALKDMLTVYDRLTDHHGAGAYELYMGEALSVQGRFDESDIYAHQAALKSEQWQNVTITYGSALLLGINAVYQSDMIALQSAIDYLENRAASYPFLRNAAINTQMAETVRAYLLGLMMEPDRSAKWGQGAADMLGNLTFTNFMVKTTRITDLILQKEYKRAIASVEASLKLDERLISLSTRNFMNVGLALCYLAIGAVPKAAESLDRSLTLAQPDHNYTFLACFRKYLTVLFMLPSIKKKHAKAIEEIKNFKIHYTKAEESRIFHSLEKHPEEMQELTDREREVAKLVADGMHNKEIAGTLYISEETVKSHIRNIFTKMNIDRRSRLVELLKQ